LTRLPYAGPSPGGGSALADPASIDRHLAQRLRALRVERGWSLDGLPRRSGASRAALSRLENVEVGPTAAVLAGCVRPMG
jgi:hypothetical protein